LLRLLRIREALEGLAGGPFKIEIRLAGFYRRHLSGVDGFTGSVERA